MDTSGKGLGSFFSETHNVFLVPEWLKITDFKFMVALVFLKRAFMALSGFCRVGQRHLVLQM